MYTCRFPVVFENLTKNQLVGVLPEWVSKHSLWYKVHVTVRALSLECTGAIKIPLWKICKHPQPINTQSIQSNQTLM